jgi:hypothetical protein
VQYSTVWYRAGQDSEEQDRYVANTIYGPLHTPNCCTSKNTIQIRLVRRHGGRKCCPGHTLACNMYNLAVVVNKT